MKEISGNLITLALEGEFDMIVHGCNCFCTMGSGIAKTVKQFFPEAFEADQATVRGDFRKLGNFTYADCYTNHGKIVKVLNAYTQYTYNAKDKPVDYDAITMCMKKFNHLFEEKHIGIPLIGAGLAGGDWNRIKGIIKHQLRNMDVTIVHFKP